jgi:hypothetical protein
MVKKMVAVFTLFSFVLVSSSCFKAYETKPETVDQNKAMRSVGEVTAIQTKSGKTIEFPVGGGPVVKDDALVGQASQEFTLDPADIKTEYRDAQGKSQAVTTKDGRTYRVVRAGQPGEGPVVRGMVPVSVPLSEIQLIWVKRVDKGKTFLYNALAIGGILVVTGVVAAILINQSMSHMFDNVKSCPFIFSFDGEQYVFDAEPYGTAICPALKRTEWVAMDHLREVHGEYRVRIANELDETQHTDELKLVVVDHPRGMKVAPDAQGRFHGFSKLLAPVRAYDRAGRDIRPFLAAEDNSFWFSQVEGRDPSKPEDLRDEITLEFPRPAGAAQVRLLANAWTTHWGSSMASTFLALPGRSLPGVYAEMNRRGPFYEKYMNWAKNEELFLLKIWVETKDGWKVRGVMNGGGPFVSKDKAYVLDISDVAGETLKIRLRPPVNFWMLNYLAADYGSDTPLRATELEAARASDRTGQDVRAKIAAVDDNDLSTGVRGDWSEAVFTTPARITGLERTVFVKATGYYDVHLTAAGEPQLATLYRLLAEPGYATRLSLEEYFKWEAGLRADARDK